MTPRIVAAQVEHVPLIAPLVREADRVELWAASRTTPFDALAYGVEHSTSAWTGFIGDDPVCMFGVVPASLLGGIGVPWMLGTDAIVRYQFTFLRGSRPCVDRMRSLYDSLANYVDDRNVVAQRWLRWLGFHLEHAEPHGPDGMPFRRFTWRRDDGRERF